MIQLRFVNVDGSRLKTNDGCFSAIQFVTLTLSGVYRIYHRILAIAGRIFE